LTRPPGSRNSSSSSSSPSSSSTVPAVKDLGLIKSTDVFNFQDGCPICLSEFTEPIALFCKHVFCKECAGGLPPTFRKCPICRSQDRSYYSRIENEEREEEKEREEGKREGENGNEENEENGGNETRPEITIASTSSSNPRTEFLLDLLKRNENDSIVIYCSIQTNINAIESFLQSQNIPCTKIQGNMTIQKREKNIRLFMEKKCRVIIFTPQIAAAGINLTVANKLIFWDYCWTHATMKQAIGRLVRLGQTSPIVNIYFLEHANSLESVGNDFLFKLDRKEKGTQLRNDDPNDVLKHCTTPLDYIYNMYNF